MLPLLYLHGLSSRDLIPPLEQFLGSGAGLSALAITRLTEAWQEEYRRWCVRDLSGADYVYCWADGLHFGVRLDADRVCTLVVVGVRADGKELVTLADGHRESTESWAGLLRDARRRGMRAPPAVNGSAPVFRDTLIRARLAMPLFEMVTASASLQKIMPLTRRSDEVLTALRAARTTRWQAGPEIGASRDPHRVRALSIAGVFVAFVPPDAIDNRRARAPGRRGRSPFDSA